MGGSESVVKHRHRLHAHDPRRQRHHFPAVPDQRRVSRRGRRGHRDARAVARQHREHLPEPVFDLRRWARFRRLGVTGSAVGTTIGRGIGVLFQLWILTSGRGRLRDRARQVRVWISASCCGWSGCRLTAMFQYMVQMASWIGVVRIIASFGSAAVAANTLAIKVIIFAILPSWGMSNAAATLVGQNLGAGKPERAENVGVAHRLLQHAVPGRRRADLHRVRRARSSRCSPPIPQWFRSRSAACACSATATSPTRTGWW